MENCQQGKTQSYFYLEKLTQRDKVICAASDVPNERHKLRFDSANFPYRFSTSDRKLPAKSLAPDLTKILFRGFRAEQYLNINNLSALLSSVDRSRDNFLIQKDILKDISYSKR